MNLLNMAKQLKTMQGEMKKARAALASQSVTGTAGRGAVVIEINGAMEVQQVKIDPQVLVKSDPAQVEKLVAEAMSDALHRVQKLVSSQLSHLTGGLGGGLNPFA